MLRPGVLMLFGIGLLFFAAVFAGTGRAETAVIPIHYRMASEVLPIVKGVISPAGTVTFAASVNSLVVTDTPEAIRRVRSFLETFDTPPRQVRIHLRFNQKTASQQRSIKGQGRVSDNGWSISTGAKTQDGVDIQVDDRKQNRQQTSEHLLVTVSGSPAYIFTGIDVPFRQRWVDLCRRYAVCTDTIEYRRIETGMEILPIIAGERANLEITPRISRVQKGNHKSVVRFTRAAARLSVPLGRWVEIGGTNQTGNDALGAVLESGRSTGTSALFMSIMVETF